MRIFSSTSKILQNAIFELKDHEKCYFLVQKSWKMRFLSQIRILTSCVILNLFRLIYNVCKFSARPQTQPQHTSVLKIGEKKPLPPHIPSFLPPFPDPHTYIKTEVGSIFCDFLYNVILRSLANRILLMRKCEF